MLANVVARSRGVARPAPDLPSARKSIEYRVEALDGWSSCGRSDPRQRPRLLESHLLLAILARCFRPRLRDGFVPHFVMHGTLSIEGGLPAVIQTR
jgi:hypothetical protein